MSRLRDLTPAQLDVRQQALYSALATGKRSTGPQVFALRHADGALTGPFNALLYSPELGLAVTQLGEQLRYSGALPAAAREAVILAVARTWSSEFEWYAHAPVARQVGLPESVIDRLFAGEDPASADPPTRAAVTVAAHLLAREPIPDARYAEVVDLFGEDGAVELAVLVGYYQLLAGLLETFRIGLPEGAGPVFGKSSPIKPRGAMQTANDIYKSAVVIDGMNNAGLTGDYLRTIRDAGVTAAMIPASITDTFAMAVERILGVRELVAANADVAEIVQSADDLTRLKRESKLGLILALEDSRQLDKDLRKVKVFHDLGVRRMQLVYTTLNDAGCGAGDRLDSGLSRFGVDLIAEIEGCGVLLDLCHCGPQTLADALEVTTRPAVWSHTNVRAVFDHPNNLADEQLDAVATNGGVVGVSGVPFYAGAPGITLSGVLDHVDHIVRRIGIDHVGIGLAIFENHPLSFYERFAALPVEIYGTPPWSWPEGISTIAEFPNLASALSQRGYDEKAIVAILGGNLLRVLHAAWDSAA